MSLEDTLSRGSKLYKQQVFAEIFATWRTFMNESNTPLEEISDEELFRILITSIKQFTSFGTNINRLNREHETTQLPIGDLWSYVQNKILDSHPPLRSYLESLPLLNHGTVQKPIRRYEVHALDYDPPNARAIQSPSPDYEIIGPDLRRLTAEKPPNYLK